MRTLAAILLLAIAGCQTAPPCYYKTQDDRRRIEQLENQLRELQNLSYESWTDHDLRLKKLEKERRP